MDAEQQVGTLLLDAAVLMVVGMGVVFSFLMILVLAVQGMSRLLKGPAESVSAKVTSNPQAGISPAVVAAISSAIEHHQKQHKELK
jgi:oxaloacetate decarboxylase gamma subunit